MLSKTSDARRRKKTADAAALKKKRGREYINILRPPVRELRHWMRAHGVAHATAASRRGVHTEAAFF